jgi:hypothetical protein
MTAIANVPELVNRFTGGNNGTPEDFHWWKYPTIAGVATTFQVAVGQSLWTHDGLPGPGAAPGGTWRNPTRATDGALRMTNPGGGRQRWLRSMFGAAWSSMRILLCDRLGDISGFSGTSTATNTINGAVTRYTGAASEGTIMVAEVYSAVGVTVTTVSCNYLDSTGTSRASGTASFGGANCRFAGNACIIPYNTTTGANSVTQIVDAKLTATTGTAGNWGISLLRPLMEVDVGSVDVSGFGSSCRWMATEDVELLTDACLSILCIPTGATINFIRGSYGSVER